MSKLSKLIDKGIITESELTTFVEVLVKLRNNNVLGKKPKKLYKKLNKNFERFRHLINISTMKQIN